MSQGLARARAQPPVDALLKVAGSDRLGALRGGLRAAAGTAWGGLTGALGADLDGPAGDCLVRPGRLGAGFCLGAMGRAGHDQEVLVNPADLGAGQARQEGRDGCAQFLRCVEGEG
jgi:hypothetical protein